jgi:hypothetical protein
MSGVHLYWKGRVPLEKIRIDFDISKELLLNAEHEAYRTDIWERAKKENADIYDGKLLVLTGFGRERDDFVLTTGFMSFSRVLTLHTLGVTPEFYGSLGVQALIFSPDLQYIIWGTRSLDSMYCPGFLASPGGMLEIQDAENIVSGLMREIKEEVFVKLSENITLVAIGKELHGTVGAGLFFEMMTDVQPDITQKVRGNEEWVDNSLEWYSVEDLADIKEDDSLDALVFARDELLAHRKGLSSVLWSQ